MNANKNPTKTILLVDDEVNVRSMLVLTLESAGYDVIAAANGEDALKKLTSDNRPNVIITDVLMPVMDGFAFYKALKDDDVLKDIPVIILTARGAMHDTFDAVGVDAFLEKTAGTQALIGKVEELLEVGKAVSGPLHSKKVLIFGTYPEVVHEMSEFLMAKRHRVKTVMTGAQIITETVTFDEDIIIMEPQLENGEPSVDVIKAVRVLPQGKDIPILLYSYYRSSELADPGIRKRVLHIDDDAQQCILAGGTEYFDRYHGDVFRRQVARYL